MMLDAYNILMPEKVSELLFGQNIVDSNSGEKPGFCTCGLCKNDACYKSKKCCGKIPCISLDGSFVQIISTTNIEVTAILNKSRSNVTPQELCTCAFRAHAYSAFCNWQFSKGTNIDAPPNCVVCAILRKYAPTQDITDEDHECNSDSEVTAFQTGNLSD